MLGPMNRDELTEVIVKPAKKLGVTFAAGLVERILDDVEAEPGNLPLLEFALTELWPRRQGNQLTHAAYTEIGEVQGALARHADASYQKLSPAQQQQMRHIFIQLVRPGEGTEDTRRLATKAELGETNWALVKQLADDRLVVTSRSEKSQVETVEVVHEALIRNWGELRDWMATDRVFRAWQERLRGAMQQWQETLKDEGSLLRGAALVEAEEKLKERPDDLSDAEQDFIHQSLAARERQAKEKEERLQKERQTAQRIIIGSSIFGVLMAVAAIFSAVQVRQAEIGQIQTSVALSGAKLANNQTLDASIESIRAGRAMQQSWWQKLWADPDLQTAVLGQLQQTANTGQERNRLEGHQGSVLSVVFSNDGRRLATSGEDGTARIWLVGGMDELVSEECNWVRDYLTNSPRVTEQDKHLCDGIGSGK